MLRLLRTALPFACFPLFLLVGCSTIYRPVYSPGKTNYKRPPEKAENEAALLPPTSPEGGGEAGQMPAGLPEGGLPAPDAAAPPAAPGMLDAPPAIPGLPQ